MNELTKEARKQYWSNIVDECNSSGIKKEKWLADHNVSQSSFYKWQKELRRENELKLDDVQPDQRVEIVPLVAPPKIEEAHTDKATLEKNGVRIEVSETVSDEFLVKLVKVLSNV